MSEPTKNTNSDLRKFTGAGETVSDNHPDSGNPPKPLGGDPSEKLKIEAPDLKSVAGGTGWSFPR